MEKEDVKIIRELNNIKKTIEIKNKISKAEDSKLKKSIPWTISVYICLSCLLFIGLNHLFFEQSDLSHQAHSIRYISDDIQVLTVLMLSLCTIFFIIFTSVYEYIKYESKKIYQDEIEQVKKHIGLSINELEKLKLKELKKLTIRLVNDYKLFSFIALNIDDKELKKELLSCCNEDILKIICKNIKLLSIIKDLPFNNDTDLLISKVHEYLEKENEKEQKQKQRKKTFENEINKKMKNEVEQEIKII